MYPFPLTIHENCSKNGRVTNLIFTVFENKTEQINPLHDTMSQMKKRTPRYFIIDFDSTFVTVEALDELAKRALKDNPDRDSIQKEIEEITRQGMEGEIGFRESLAQRLYLFKASREHIDQLITYLKRNVTASIKRNKEFFKANADTIYIISGGFKEYIVPVVAAYGIPPEHVLANEFQFNSKGVVTGFNDKNLLSKNKGKVKQVKKLSLAGKVYVIGDGYTDLEIKLAGQADTFYAFTENVRREAVVEKADKELPNFDELLYQFKETASVTYPKNRIKVLLLEKVEATAVAYFKQEGYEVETINRALDEDELCEKIQDVSILGIRSKTKITKKVISKAKRLLCIGAFCIGTNQIDLAATTKKGIAVFNAPYSNTRSVVELVMGEMMVLTRRVFEKSNLLHAGTWDKSAEGAREIRGKKLGIIGYGSIGYQLSVLAEALGMEVYFYDCIEKLALGNARKCETLQELLKKADIISIHVDGRPENADLIGEKEFKLMKNGVIFINSSRGHIVDLEALAQAVKTGKVKGAAVDVFPYEPKANGEQLVTPLQNLPNVILTPHIGGSTEEAQRNIAEFVSRRIIEFISTGTSVLSVNMPQIQLPLLTGGSRFIHIHENTPGILAQINTIVAKHNVNIEGQYLKTNEQVGYVIVDVNQKNAKALEKELRQIPGTIRVRALF